MLSSSEIAAILATVTSEVERRHPEIDINWLSDLIHCAIDNYGGYKQDDREITVCHFSGLWNWQRLAAADKGICPFPAPRWTDMFGCPASDALGLDCRK